jgi:hypothetical protein
MADGENVLGQDQAEYDSIVGYASVRAYPDAVVSATNERSGIKVTIDPNGSGVTARNPAGESYGRKTLFERPALHLIGSPVVRYVGINAKGMVSLVLGKHRYVEAELHADKLRLRGED